MLRCALRDGLELVGAPADLGDALEGPSHWYAVQVRPRREKIIATALRSKGYEDFLPLYSMRRVWSDRIARIEAPLFPGYVFCRFDLAGRRLPVLKTPGVIRLVGTAGVATPIDSGEIAAIQAIARSDLASHPWPYLKVGQRVRIEYGSLAGVEGILIELKKQHRLVVSVTLLQRSVAVDVEREWVVPCGATGAVRTSEPDRP